MISLRICLFETCGACWVETTMVSTRTGLPFASYSTDTWLLESGRTHGILPALRRSVRVRMIRCARMIGMGINSGVSSQA